MNKENVVIIGGGIAGIEACKQLLTLGYQPILIERRDHLGGHVGEWHKLFPDMTPSKPIIEQLITDISGTQLYLNTTVTGVTTVRDKGVMKYEVAISRGIKLSCHAILVASGFQLFDAHKKEEYGYGVYDHVITNRDLEGWMNGTKDARIPERPQKIGFVHCVGSRDLKAGNSQCSKVCCMTAVKQAIEVKERFPDVEVYCFYMDLRLFGKKYEDFYINAQRDYGVHFIRGRVSEVGETIDGRLQIKAEDTLVGKPLKVQLDLLVLMSGIVSNPHTQSIADMLKLETDADGFLKSADNILNILDSKRPGIFLAGACTGAKTIPETVAEARSAALAIHNYLHHD